MTTPFLVAQLGARMHFAVPRILQRAGQLARLFTDIAANRGALRCLNCWPKPIRPAALTRLLSRRAEGIPPELIRACPLLGIRYARQFARTQSDRERVELFLRVGEQFGAWVTRQDWAAARAVFVYNTAGLEVLRQARQRGLRTVSEQTIAPFAVERSILAQERARYPSWDRGEADCPAFTSYANRERQEWQLADTILCGSTFVRDSIQQVGGPVEKCHVVPYGVDASFAGAPAAEHAGPLRVLTVGAVGLRKGTPYVVEAAKRLRGRANFRWVGAFKLADSARAELGSDVEFTGPVPRSEITQHYAWADVFLLPSLCEGSATATYEALTAARPVVCTPNCGSVVRDGIEGFITPVRQVDVMVERLERLAADGELRRQMAQAARLRATELDYEAYAKGLLEAVNNEMESRDE